MKFFIITLFTKLLCFAASLLGGGTDLPGRIALKLDPNYLKRFSFSGKIISVTGSNGKTTTSNLIAHSLKKNGFSVVNNAKGSNMPSGIATTLLNSSNLRGFIDKDFIVLECDEDYCRFMFGDLPIHYFLVLNLLRDQVVRNGHPDLVFAKIKEAIEKRPDMTLILNSNEPISQNLAYNLSNPVLYFGMDRTERSTDSCVSGTNDCKICPRCFSPMIFDFFHYNHLGKFHCSNCDYHSYDASFFGKDVNFNPPSIKINDCTVFPSYNTTFNIFNTVAAAAVVCTAGSLSVSQFGTSIQDFTVAKDRLDTFNFEGHNTTLMMTKQNAASLDQSISYVLEQEGTKSVALSVNNVLYLEYKDISWLYDVSFNRLKGKIEKIICTGNRAYDVAVCLKASGFSDDDLVIENNIDNTKDAFRKAKGDIYILAASAFGNEGKILEVLKK